MLKEINVEYSLEGLLLKLQYFGQRMWRTNSLEETSMLGKIEDRRKGGVRGWDGWMASFTQWPWVWTNSRRLWRTGKPGMLQSMGSRGVGHDWVTKQLKWTKLGLIKQEMGATIWIWLCRLGTRKSVVRWRNKCKFCLLVCFDLLCFVSVEDHFFHQNPFAGKSKDKGLQVWKNNRRISWKSKWRIFDKQISVTV